MLTNEREGDSMTLEHEFTHEGRTYRVTALYLTTWARGRHIHALAIENGDGAVDMFGMSLSELCALSAAVHAPLRAETPTAA